MTWYRKIWRFKSNNNKQQVFSNLETCCLTQNGLLIFSLPSILYPFVNHLFYPMRGTLNGYQFARHAYLSMNAISFFKYLPLPPLSMFFIIAVSENLCKHGIEISYIPRDLITVIFYYQISLNPLKTQSLSQVSFPLLFPLRYIVPPVFTNSDKGKNKGKKII